jgi:Zn-finger nucleic acid-binding protein
MSRRDRPDEGRPMATECCGKPRDTPFCPRCGGRLAGASQLDDLLKHCRATAARLRREHGKWTRYAEDSFNGDFCLENAGKRLARSEVWEARGDALARLMAAEE